MNAKHRIFADYYIATLDVVKSYKQAYKSCKSDSGARVNGGKILQDEEVIAYIDMQMAEKNSDVIATANEVLEFLTAQMRSEFVKDRERIKCAELLGKRHRLFIDRIEADITQTVVFEGESELLE